MGKGRAPCCDKTQVKRGPWSPDEDLKLITFVKQHGHHNWPSLPKQAGLLRCGKSCRLRWINYLRPDVKRGNFTKEEEDSIIKLHRSFGNKWSRIASLLPGRTDNEIKNMWNTHLKKRAATFKDADGDASSSCSSSSFKSDGKRKIDVELDQDSVVKKPCEEVKNQKLISSSLSSCCKSNVDHNTLQEEVNISFEYDSDFWNTLELENLDSYEPDKLNLHQSTKEETLREENMEFVTKDATETFQYEIEWNPEDFDAGICFSDIWPSPS